jgi:RNA polymerase sigma factor (sigma-70 family)
MTEKEYNECVDAHADSLYRFILKNLRHEEDAQDVVQSAYEKMWRNREKVVSETAKSYLFTVAYHQMIDHIRKNKRYQLQDAFAENTSVQEGSQPGFKKELEAALERLTPLQKSLVLLKDYEGYSYEEIGSITALNANQVKVYLHRARIQIREFLVKKENIL